MTKLSLFPFVLVLASCLPELPEFKDASVAKDDTASDPVDADGDGYDQSVDCDDTNADIYPGAVEVCDGVDNNCNGLVDDEDPNVRGQPVWYMDVDGDGYGNTNYTITACEQPSGYVDNDEDCDDTNRDIHPDAVEVCDGVDNNCNGLVDDDNPDVDLTTGYEWYEDADGDGYGNALVITVACEQPSGYVDNDEDCDDTNRDIHPDAVEVCDSVDNNCNGLVDDADPDVDLTTGYEWYEDADGDTYGDPEATTMACEVPSGYVANDADCDDTNVDINPDAVEVCDSVDNNCNGLVDDDDPDVDLTTGYEWYEDADGDGYGNALVTTVACATPSGYVADDTDCDDTRSDINPGEEDEVATVWDENCDGLDGRESLLYTGVSSDISPSGVNLVTDELLYSTFTGGTTEWMTIYGRSPTLISATFTSIYSGTLEGMELTQNSSNALEMGYMYANPVSGVLTAGQEYIVVASFVHVGSTGSVQVAIMNSEDRSIFSAGGTSYTDYDTLSSGDEVILGGAFTANSSSEVFYICSKSSIGREYDVVVTHFAVYEGL